MRPIPEEARATLQAIRTGKTDKQYRDDIWQRRVAEHPTKTRARWNWPIKWRETVGSNIATFKRKK